MSEEKYRFTVRLSSEADRLMKESMARANCQSQNEFTEKAIRFYAGYLAANDATEYLAPVIAQMMRGTLDGFCAHISRNLFRLAVEDAKTWNLIAGLFQVSPEKLQYIHNKAIGEVKRMNGRLTYEQLFANPPELDGVDITEDEE